MNEELQQEIERYKETNRRLNRRCQKLEKRVSKYRRRYVAVMKPAKEWHDRIKWDYQQIHAMRNELWDQLSLRKFYLSWFKGTLRIINETINTFFQRLLTLIRTGHFFPEKIWKQNNRLAELERKVKEYEARNNRI